ncbi:MAG TPA: hypothetical protein PLF81_02100 [Candidatus Anammoximicrobium sp.]|nr:hypothetical protein [Candidatus Anammoximicrobium sp.]
MLSGSGWVANSFPTDGYARGLGVALDRTGNVYVTGYLQKTVNFVPTASGSGMSATSINGTDDVFVAKLDPAGRFLWLRTIGGAGNDHASHIAVSTGGDVYVTGSFRETAVFGSTQLTSAGGDDIFVTKLDTDGSFQWALRAGGPETTSWPYYGDDDHVAGIVLGSDGIYIAGNYRGAADFGAFRPINQGGIDAFLAKITPSADGTAAAFQWVQTIGTTNDEAFHGIALGRGAGGVESIHTTLESSNDNGFYAVTAYSTLGELRWTANVAMGEGQDSIGPAVYQESAETYSLYTGTSGDANPSDQVVTKLDMAGHRLFSVNLPTGPNELSGAYLIGLAADATGVYAAGKFCAAGRDFDPDPSRAAMLSPAGNAYYDGFIWKLNHSGQFQMVRQMGGAGSDDQDDEARAIAVQAGDIYSTGRFTARSAVFDTGTAFVGPASVTTDTPTPKFFVLKTTQDMGEVFGRVFNDLNGNGIQDTYQGIPEPAWVGGTVSLDLGTEVATVKSRGDYAFEHVLPGAHNVQLALSGGWTSTTPPYAISVPPSGSVDGCDFGVYHASAFRTYRNSVATKYPATSAKTALSTIKITDSYEIYDVAVNVTVSATPGTLYLIGPDGTKVKVTAGSTIHLSQFNYKNVKGTWTLQIGYSGNKGSVTGWSLTVLGASSASTAQNAAFTEFDQPAYATLTTATMYQQTSVRSAAVDEVFSLVESAHRKLDVRAAEADRTFSAADGTHRKLNATVAGLALADIDLLSSRWTDFAATF